MTEPTAKYVSDPNARIAKPSIKSVKLADDSTKCIDLYLKSSYEKPPLYRRVIDSFKPINLADDHIDISKFTKFEQTHYALSKQPLMRKLKKRHLQMIGFGGLIGTGLFVGSGYSLWQGGPAGQLLSCILVGFSIFSMVNALGELTVQYPVSGAFHVYFTRFIDPSWGFTLSMLYTMQLLLLFPSELVACSLTIGYWNKNINPLVWVALFYVTIFMAHVFGVKGFGEVEFGLSVIKVVAVVGFIILGICLVCGAGKEGYIGARYWHDPGPFHHGFKGLCLSFISANYVFGGIEFVALAAAETVNPRRSIPRAIKQVFWRVLIFYVLTSVVIGCLVPYNDPRLLSGKTSSDINASPFVIAINNGGIQVLPDIMNAVILLSVISVGNASVFGSSRSLVSLAALGSLPKCVGYVDRMGRPIVALMITFTIGLLGFMVTDSKHQGDVFTWFFSVCSLSFSSIAICVAHLRFRWAINRQARSLDEVLFVSPTGVWGSSCATVILSLAVIGIIWTSISPIDPMAPPVVTFWKNCLSLPIMIILFVGHKTLTRSWNQLLVDCQHVDLDVGRRDLDVDVIKQDDADKDEKLQSKPFWYRLYRNKKL